jgi:hypothetical protein
MSAEQNKRNIVSFRLSDAEYGAVETVSRVQGFTSVSLFARSATLTNNSNDGTHSPFDADMNRLWRRLEVLTAALEQITIQARRALDRLGTVARTGKDGYGEGHENAANGSTTMTNSSSS